MRKICPVTAKKCESSGCTDTTCSINPNIPSSEIATGNKEAMEIQKMKYGETKRVLIPISDKDGVYKMPVSITRVLGGWLFVEITGSSAPINWFVKM